MARGTDTSSRWLLALVVALVLAGLIWGGLRMAQRPPAAPVDDTPKAQADLEDLEPVLKEAASSGHYSEILPRARKLVQDHPNFAPAHTLLGNILLTSGHPAEAYAEMEASLKLEPRQPELVVNAAALALILGHPDEAERGFAAAVALEPAAARYRVLHAGALIKQGHLPEARREAETAIAADSESHEAHAMLSDILELQQDRPGALEQIQKAIDRTPISKPQARLTYVRKKAAVLRRMDRVADALRVLDDLDPASRWNLETLDEVAACYLALGKPADSAVLFEEALRQTAGDNADPDWHLVARVVEWSIRAGDQERARRGLQLLKELKSDPGVLKGLEEAVDKMGKG